MQNMWALVLTIVAALLLIALQVRVSERNKTLPQSEREANQRRNRDQWKIVGVLAATAVGTGLLIWLGWALWGRPAKSAPPSDRWFTVVTGISAVGALAAVATGALFAVRYGRRASVEVTAKAHPRTGGVLVAVRPTVKAVGVFPVKFHKTRGAIIRVTELYVGGDGRILDARHWDQSNIFGPEFVEPGETLATSSVFPLPPPTLSTIGWRVSVEVAAPTRFLSSSGAWADQIFVPLPKNDEVTS